MTRGLVIAAPASGCGKTVVTLALLRALRQAGMRVGSLKVGPDYIDPGFHRAASGGPCRNYDVWAMRPATLDRQLAAVATDTDLVLAEGVTGLFDGAADGTGSTAAAAARLGWPVVLVADATGQGASVAALVEGFDRHRADTRIAGVILNRVGSDRHRDILRAALAGTGVPVVGMIPRDPCLALPDRHLGLVQAAETSDLDRWIDRAADTIAEVLDRRTVLSLATETNLPAEDDGTPPLPPPGQRIAVADDAAFSFTYPHVLDGWRATGAEIDPFSPLADEAPTQDADAVYLPGGYPELHAGRLAACGNFLAGLRDAAARDAVIYGECGGFMVLGRSLIDRDGQAHGMAGLLPVETSFADPRLHLGYRKISLRGASFLGTTGAAFRGHEFHYSSRIGERSCEALFDATDATGAHADSAGCRQGKVMGSYLHLIDRAD